MFGSTVIDIAVGLVFVYLLLSLVCSAINELLEHFLKNRARDLERGLRELLHDEDWVKRLYNHPLIWGLFEGEYSPSAKNLPSYIPATNFALTIMDLVLPGEGTTGATRSPSGTPGVVVNVPGVTPAADAADPLQPLRDGIKNIKSENVRTSLLSLVNAAGRDVAKARENIESWFNNNMDRVSGWYKRRSQKIILISGFALAVLLNADSVAIVRVLSTDRTMRESLAAAAEAYAKAPSSAEASPPTAQASPVAVQSPSTAAAPVRSSRPGARAGTANTSAPASVPSPAVISTSPSPLAAASISNAAPPPAQSPPTPGCEGAKNTAECRIEQNLKEIKKLGLPIGWTREENDPRSIHITPQAWAERGVGWLITAFAVSLGAPFWFDLLNKFVVVRSTVKPKEKSPDEKSKD